MNYLMVTRFNNYTYNENNNWRLNNKIVCVYNSPVCIKNTIPLDISLYIIEMNNETNKIMGVGKILNKNYTDKIYRIHEDRNYNRYTYRGKQWIGRDVIYKDLLQELENILFKTKKHFKRGQGISELPQKIAIDYLKIIINLFNMEEE